jgi:hypothetical protein
VILPTSAAAHILQNWEPGEVERESMTVRLANTYLGIALLGGLVGAAVGLLVAPAPGTETRRKVVGRSSVEDQELLLRRAEMAVEPPDEELDLLASA